MKKSKGAFCFKKWYSVLGYLPAVGPKPKAMAGGRIDTNFARLREKATFQQRSGRAHE